MSRLRLLAWVALALSAALFAGDVASHAAARMRAPEVGPPQALAAVLEEEGHSIREVRASLGALDERPGEGRGLVVVGGSRAYAPSELDSIRRFVETGGRLLVFAEPDVAAILGVTIAASPVVDAEADGGVRVAWGAPAETTSSVPRAWPLQPREPSARALAWSANGSFVDTDGDGRAQAGDVPGPFALAYATRAGVAAGLVEVGSQPPDIELLRALAAEAFPGTVEVLVDATRAARGMETASRAVAAGLMDLAHLPAWGLLHVGLFLGAGATLAADALRPSTRDRRQDGLDAPIRRGGPP